MHVLLGRETDARWVCVCLMCEQGVDRVIGVDLQPPGEGQVEGFFSPTVSVVSLRSVGAIVKHFARMSLNNVVVVAPNEACVHLACDMQVRSCFCLFF